ncbi:MAG TPA: DUF4038 domain-containing protein [Chloroflexota bacterium]
MSEQPCSWFDRLAQATLGLSVGHADGAIAANPSAAYPLKISARGRYLVDQNDAPFLVVGDSPQALIGNLSEQDVEFFLADRRQHGFNSIWVNLVCDAYTGCRDDGNTFDGVPPFTTAGDLSTPNEAYFSRADRYIDLAAAYGFNVFLDPIETGGWLDILRANGAASAYNYGRYLGSRYRNTRNIIWLNGNDFQSWQNARDDELVLAVARGISGADPGHLQTLELNYHVSSSLDDPRWVGLIQLESAYTYMPTYAEVLKDYNRRDARPVLMIEANYELQDAYRGPATLRRQEFWSMLSGATGQLYGNRYTWQFAKDWKDHLDSVGSRQFGYAAEMFGSRRWFDLVPDQQHLLVTAGSGTFSDAAASVNDNDFAPAAMTPDATLAVVYVPRERTITVDMSRLSGPVRARWYDPSSNTYVRIGDSPLPNAGLRDFRTPGRNSDGDEDWALVLEVAP